MASRHVVKVLGSVVRLRTAAGGGERFPRYGEGPRVKPSGGSVRDYGIPAASTTTR
jgi:hypothetical protein